MTGLIVSALIVGGVCGGLFLWVKWMKRSNDRAFAAMTDEQRFVYEDLMQQIENPQPPLGPFASEGDIVPCPHCGTHLYRWAHTVQWSDFPNLLADLEPIDERLPQHPRYGDTIPVCPECHQPGWSSGRWLATVHI